MLCIILSVGDVSALALGFVFLGSGLYLLVERHIPPR